MLHRLLNPIPELSYFPRDAAGRKVLKECCSRANHTRAGLAAWLLMMLGGLGTFAWCLERAGMSSIAWIVATGAALVMTTGLVMYFRILRPILRDELYRMAICPSCGYCLLGNTSGTCPECGTSIPLSFQNELQAKANEVEYKESIDRERSLALKLAIVLAVGVGIPVHLSSRQITWVNGPSWADIWGGFVFHGLALGILSAIIFGMAYGVGLVMRSSSRAQRFSWFCMMTAIFLGYAMVILVGVAILFGMAFM